MAGLTRNYLKLYEIVMNDELEWPMFIGTANECAAYLGIKPARFRCRLTVHNDTYKHKWMDTYKIVDPDLKERITDGCIEEGRT